MTGKAGSGACALLAPVALVLASCGQGTDAAVPGDANSTKPYEGIVMGEVIRFTGTEPFWGGKAKGTTLTYTTPDNPDGEVITASRFAGRGGLSFSGTLAAGDFTMAITPAECSDGMSDRTYPFAVTLVIGGETRQGCAWTDGQPFAGPEAP